MATSFKEYKAKVLKASDYPEVIELARKEYGVVADKVFREFNLTEIPFNLEEEYLNALLKEGDFDTATRLVERMKISYPGDTAFNLIESFVTRINLTKSIREIFNSEQSRLKQELNQHNLTTISIVVGVITIFGVANQTLVAKSFNEGVTTFFAIVFSIVILTIVAFLTNSFFYKNKK